MARADKITELVVCILFGWLGIHRFMRKQIGLGIVYLLTFGIFGIGWVIDIIILVISLSQNSPDQNKETQLRSGSIDGTMQFFRTQIPSTKLAAKQQRAQWKAYPDNYCILDTETTGLKGDAEIIEIAVIDMNGNTLLDTLVKPIGLVPESATKIHGIKDKDLVDAPEWSTVYGLFKKTTEGRILLIYNAEFDLRLIYQSCIQAGIPFDMFKANCVMKNFATSIGQGEKWPKLDELAVRYEIQSAKKHRAIDDCHTARAIIMAAD